MLSPDFLDEEQLTVSDLLLSASGAGVSPSLKAIEVLVAERNAILGRLLPADQQTPDNSVRVRGFSPESFRLADDDELERLTRDFGTGHPKFSKQGQAVFEYAAISRRLESTLRTRFRFLSWRREEAGLFEHFDRVADWGRLLAKFAAAAGKFKISLKSMHLLNKILESDAESREQALRACAYFLRREWQPTDFGVSVASLFKQLRLPNRTLFRNIAELPLGFLKQVFEKVELSLANDFMESKLDQCFKQEITPNQRQKVIAWIEEIDPVYLRQIITEIEILVMRHHSSLQEADCGMNLLSFVEQSPRKSQFEDLDKKTRIFSLLGSNEIALKNVNSFIQACEDECDD